MGLRLQSFPFFVLFAALAVAAGASCGASSEGSASGAGGSCVGPSCNPEDAGRDQIVADVPVPDSPPDTKPSTTSALCGTVSEGCTPDDPNPPECQPSDAGTGAEPPGADAGSDVASEGGADADPDAATAPPPKYGCGVESANGKPFAQCSLAGSGESGSPCVSGSDCAPGLACVSEGTTAACRPYCCDEKTTCATGAYCAERPMKLPSGGTVLPVPVCVLADDCSLDEPYPCPTGKQCKCKAGTACAVVKDDGTTSCVVPGEGRAGESCPCAAGFLCSKSTNTCLKLCSTTAAKSECGTGKCLSVAGLPDGFGVCGLGSLDGG